MAFPKYKDSLKKTLNSNLSTVVSSLRKENAYLKKILAEHYKLVERFLSLEAVRIDTFQQQTSKDKKTALPSKQSSESEVSPMDKGPTTSVEELQNHLRDALEKNKQLLERDQQREAYVREILDRMFWMEKQLNQANQAPSQQHKEDHSDEKTRLVEMQEHYERLLQKAKDELREEIDLTHQNLIIKIWCKEREIEVEEPKQGEYEVQLKDRQCKLDDERSRSANFDLQANLTQKCLSNQYHKDQENITELEQQIKISSEDIDDENQDGSLLNKQITRILKTLQKSKDHMTKDSKLSRQSLASPYSIFLNESLLECPGCQVKYPASDYRELIKHIDICLL